MICFRTALVYCAFAAFMAHKISALPSQYTLLPPLGIFTDIGEIAMVTKTEIAVITEVENLEVLEHPLPYKTFSVDAWF